MQKLLSDTKRFNFFESKIQKLASLLVKNIVITDYDWRIQGILEFFGNLLLIILWATLSNAEHVISNPNCSFKYQIHLLHFILLIIYNSVFICVFEFPRHKSEGDIIEEPRIGIKVYLLTDTCIVSSEIEKATESEKDILKQIHVHYLVLYTLWQSTKVTVINRQGGKAIVRPVVGEVPLDLTDQYFGQGLVIGEASEISHPVVEVPNLIYKSHFLLVVSYDLYEAAHYIWKEGHTAEHQKYSY